MSSALRLVLVEDNEAAREEMKFFLAKHAFTVHEADCGEQLNDVLRRHPVDLVILDINLPHEDGYSIAQRLRVSHPYLGLVMLTARTRHVDRTAGYQSGADVYITKPVRPDELLAVIGNLANRLAPPVTSRLTLSRKDQSISRDDGASLSLTTNEYLFLELLALSPNQEADVEYLRAMLNRNGSEEVSKDSIYVLISRLRTKLSRAFGVGSALSAIRGYGYKLNISLALS